MIDLKGTWWSIYDWSSRNLVIGIWLI